jgi:LCCL domain-containing protein
MFRIAGPLPSLFVARVLMAGSLAALVCGLPGSGSRARAGDGPSPDAKPAAAAGAAVEVSLVDGSTLKLALRDERIQFQTRYGKLLIPAADVRRVEFRSRLSPDMARRVDTAIDALGSKDFHKREAASAELLRFGEQAYPALTRAAADPDKEVVRRAREVLEKIRESVPAERLVLREDDVIWAGDSQIVGRIAAASLTVDTLPFGVQSLRYSDMRSLRSLISPIAVAVDAAPDPGTLQEYQDQIGRTFSFKVTGRTAAALAAAPAGALGTEWVWGTDVYSADSSLALAAVHAGVLRPGQTTVVKVTILGPQPAFTGSTRNGVTSQPYGAWPGSFKVSR